MKCFCLHVVIDSTRWSYRSAGQTERFSGFVRLAREVGQRTFSLFPLPFINNVRRGLFLPSSINFSVDVLVALHRMTQEVEGDNAAGNPTEMWRVVSELLHQSLEKASYTHAFSLKAKNRGLTPHSFWPNISLEYSPL